jgi:glutamate--cysteine ligase
MSNLSPIRPNFNRQAAPRIGLELEMFGYDAQTLAPLGTPGSRLTPQHLMERLAAEHPSSQLSRDSSTGEILGLDLGQSNFSLEPGGQIEYATHPHLDLQSVANDLRQGLQLLEQASRGEVVFLDHGTNPLAAPTHPLLVPKRRYLILDRYFASQPQGRGIDMMRHSATAQPNIDIVGGPAWNDAVQLSLVLTPMVRALFANSVYFQGRRLDPKQSERQRIWACIDPSRTGIPPIAFQPDIAAAYADWAEQAYVFLVKDLPLEEQPEFGQLTYQQWRDQGYRGTYPDDKDWQTHLNTLFPDLRLRQFLEVRMVDAQPFEHSLAPLAFWAVALREGRAAVWQFLKSLAPIPEHIRQPRTEAPVLDDLLVTVLNSAPDPLAQLVLQRFRHHRLHLPAYPESAREFVRLQATPRPSQQLLV